MIEIVTNKKYRLKYTSWPGLTFIKIYCIQYTECYEIKNVYYNLKFAVEEAFSIYLYKFKVLLRA